MEPLALRVASLDQVDEARRELYEPAGDGDGFQLLLDTPPDRLLAALKAERQQHKESQHAAIAATAETQAAAAARDAALAEAKKAKDLLLAARIASAAQAGGLHHYALDDACRLGREHFTIDAAGAVVPIKEGGPSLSAWIAASRTTSPHWWPGTSGTGAGHGRSDAGAGVSIRRSSFDAMSPQQRGAALQAGIIVTD